MTPTASPEPVYPIEACRSETCRRAIIWARTEKGRSMPVDAAPTDQGTVRLFRYQGVVQARVVTAEEADRMRQDPLAVPLRTAHFATCPASDAWRVRR